MMFNGQRYLTKGVQEQVSIPLQVTLWLMIENLKIEADYLQIFEIEQISDNQIKITHRQEEPQFESVTVKSGKIASAHLKIYVIDDQDYSTMLLADEY